MKKNYAHALAMFLLGLSSLNIHGQGSIAFTNLNFEKANPIPLGAPYFVASSNGVPGWTTYYDEFETSTIAYDTVSGGGAGVSIHDSRSTYEVPIQGNYSVLLRGSGAGPATSAAIGQIGQIPVNSLSLQFWADSRSNIEVTFGGIAIPMFRLTSTASYDVFGGDVSRFAGQTAELRFTGPGNSGGYFDNIFFSTPAVPEPSGLCLLGLGALLVGWHSRRSKSGR